MPGTLKGTRIRYGIRCTMSTLREERGQERVHYIREFARGGRRRT